MRSFSYAAMLQKKYQKPAADSKKEEINKLLNDLDEEETKPKAK